MFLQTVIAIQTQLAEAVRRTQDEERGQTFVEWLAVMAIIVALFAVLGPQMGGVATEITNSIKDAIGKL